MGLSFDLRSLANPKKRLVMGILFLVLGAVCVLGQDWYSGVTRENSTQVEAVFEDCKYHSQDRGINTNDIYLVFEDYGSNLDIHPSCADDQLTQRLFDLPSGTKMKLLVNETTNEIYELEVAGDIWLDFDTAKQKIDKNVTIVKYVGFVFLPIGAVCLITVVIALIWKAIVPGRR